MSNSVLGDQASIGNSSEKRWLFAALTIALVYSLLALRLAFRLPCLVQDDARQHVFWMRRYLDPALFPNDLIADYFQTVAPAGYKAFYWIFAKFGVDPMLLAKLLPAAIGLLGAYLAFRVFMELLPDPRGAFIASVLICQMLWIKDDVMSATPRAFGYPLFLLFVLLFLRRSFFACSVVLVLEGLFYPPGMIISAGLPVLNLIQRDAGRFRFSCTRSDYVFCAAVIVLAALFSIGFENSAASYGPIISAKTARAMREFGPEGRTSFFHPGLGFWLTNQRTGFFPRKVPAPIFWGGLIFFLLYAFGKFPGRQRMRKALSFILRLLLVLFGLWAVAHAFLFKFYLPSRYSQWVLYLLEPIVAAVAISTLFDASKRWTTAQIQIQPWMIQAAKMSLYLAGIALLLYPHFRKGLPRDSYLEGKSPKLYAYLQTQPKDVRIASLTESDMIPTFAQRSTLASAEYAIPYHQGYYRQIRERGQDLVRAHYSSRLDEVQEFIRKHHVDLWIVDRRTFQPGFPSHAFWFRDVVPMADIEQRLEQGEEPMLARLVPRCKVWEDEKNIVLDAHAIERATP